MVDVGEMPPVLGTGRHYWMTTDARRTLETRTMAALASLGLARNNVLNSLWRNTLTVMARAEREYYSFCNFAGAGSCSVLVATYQGDAVRVIVTDDIVALDPVPDQWHATALLDALPDVPGAAVRDVTIAKSFYNNPHEAARHPLAEPVDTRDRDRLRDVMARDRTAVHQLYTARRDSGERLRSSPITAIDLAEDGGRVLTYSTGDDDIVMTSATSRETIRTLNNTMNSLGL